MAVWRLIAHHKHAAQMAGWIKANQRITIGWGLIGNLSVPQFNESIDIKNEIKRVYTTLTNSDNGGKSLWNLLQMQIGDLVIVRGNGVDMFIVEVTGFYQYSPHPNISVSGEYNHQRAVKLIDRDPNALWAEHKPLEGEGIYTTLVRCE